jgi:rhodanese-related sulfurtransferase
MIVVVCHVGLRSYEACQYLRSAGFDHAFFMEGGLSLWQSEMVAMKQGKVPDVQVEDQPAVTEELAEA